MPGASAIPAKRSVSKGQERHPADPAPGSTGGWGHRTGPPKGWGHLRAPAPHTNCNHKPHKHPWVPPAALQRVTDRKRIFANKLGLDLQLPVPARGVHSTVLCQLCWHSSTLPLFFSSSPVQVGLFMSEKHKWEKGPGKDRVKYHLRVKHHLKVTLRLNLDCWRD